MADILDLLLQLCCEFAKEFVRGINLVLEIFLCASNCVETLSSELMKVIFESEEVALHTLKIILVSLKVYVLLLGDLLAKVNLFDHIIELPREGFVLGCLLIDGGLPRLCLLFIHVLYFLKQALVSCLQALYFFFQ